MCGKKQSSELNKSTSMRKYVMSCLEATIFLKNSLVKNKWILILWVCRLRRLSKSWSIGETVYNGRRLPTDQTAICCPYLSSKQLKIHDRKYQYLTYLQFYLFLFSIAFKLWWMKMLPSSAKSEKYKSAKFKIMWRFQLSNAEELDIYYCCAELTRYYKPLFVRSDMKRVLHRMGALVMAPELK